VTGHRDHLLAALSGLVRACRADAAVLWHPGRDHAGSAIAAFPAALVAPGSAWPTTAPPPGAPVRLLVEPGALAARVPTGVRLQLPAPPRAVAEATAPDGLAALVVVWAGEDPGDDAVGAVGRAMARITELALRQHDEAVAAGDAARLRAVVAALDQAIVIIDDVSGCGDVNLAGAALLGVAEGEVPAGELAAALRALRGRSTDAAALEARAARLLTTPDATVANWVWRFDTAPTHLRVSSVPLEGVDVSGRVWVFDDVSNEMALLEHEKAARLDAEEASFALAASEERYRTAVEVLRTTFDALMDPALLLSAVRDDDGHLVDFTCTEANRAAQEEQGLGPGDLVGGQLRGRLPDDAVDRLVAVCREVVETGDGLHDNDMVTPLGILRPGRRYDVRIVRAGDGVVISWRDVTERRLAAEALERRARHDELTGLPNRAEVFERLEARLASTAAPTRQLAALFCDVDHFKAVNDTWGHAAGDAVLCSVAEEATAAIRAGDTFGRIGGDEFLALLDGVHDLEHAVQIAQRLHARLVAPVRRPGGPIAVGVSVGVVLARPGEQAGALLARADEAMYRAKQTGRNRVTPIG
jgi:diguanylate cyclase (GGDEF)-like protein